MQKSSLEKISFARINLTSGNPPLYQYWCDYVHNCAILTVLMLLTKSSYSMVKDCFTVRWYWCVISLSSLHNKIYVKSYRSSHRRFCKKRCLGNFEELTGKHLFQELFFKKLQTEAYNFLKNETLAQVFSWNFAKFLRTTFLKNTSRRLLLELHYLVVLKLLVIF